MAWLACPEVVWLDIYIYMYKVYGMGVYDMAWLACPGCMVRYTYMYMYTVCMVRYTYVHVNV